MTTEKWLSAVVAAAVVSGCAASGPVEVLEGHADGEEASCFRVSTCLQQATDARDRGRFEEATPYLVEACRRGAPEGCRLLAADFVVGAIGEPDVEAAEKLYRWGCGDADDARSCHGLGELVRLGATDEARIAAGDYFGTACELGDQAGCHDEAVVQLEQHTGEPDEDDEQWAAGVFENTCEEGLAAGCMNFAYMTAAGRGVGRDHNAARRLFESTCQVDDWRGHDLAGLTHDVDPDVYAVAEFSPDVACEQLEVLVVGLYEERIGAAFDAENDALRSCYDDARDPGERTVGRITIAAGVSDDAAGVSPRIVDDELGLDAVGECVETVLSRHLDDQSDGAVYETRWGVSFLHPPHLEETDEIDWELQDCDAEAVQLQVAESFGDLRGCGSGHLERHPDDAGAVVALWTMEPSGQVGQIALETTVRRDGLEACLEETISRMRIPEFDGDACPVQVPFVFSDGHRLHFSVIGAQP